MGNSSLCLAQIFGQLHRQVHGPDARPMLEVEATREAELPRPFGFPTLVRGRREPIIALGLKLPSGWQRVDFYVDSGAAYSIVSAQLATAVGFDFKQGQRASVQVGDGHCLPVFLYRLPLQLGPRLIEARIGFAEQYGLHFNLLGRLDIFDKFNVSFRERDGVVIFEPVE